MNLIEIITKIFGNKAQKDMREIQPYVERIKATYEKIDLLSDDELRAHSASLMKRIQDAVQVKKDKINELKSSIEDLEIEKREKVYDEIRNYEEHIAEETINNMIPYKNPNAFENQLLNDIVSGGSNMIEYANGGADVYGYTHDQYNRDVVSNIQNSQQHPTDVLDASDYAFFTSVNDMLF
jgi:hypothetical protein